MFLNYDSQILFSIHRDVNVSWRHQKCFISKDGCMGWKICFSKWKGTVLVGNISASLVYTMLFWQGRHTLSVCVCVWYRAMMRSGGCVRNLKCVVRDWPWIWPTPNRTSRKEITGERTTPALNGVCVFFFDVFVLMCVIWITVLTHGATGVQWWNRAQIIL